MILSTLSYTCTYLAPSLLNTGFATSYEDAGQQFALQMGAYRSPSAAALGPMLPASNSDPDLIGQMSGVDTAVTAASMSRSSNHTNAAYATHVPQLASTQAGMSVHRQTSSEVGSDSWWNGFVARNQTASSAAAASRRIHTGVEDEDYSGGFAPAQFSPRASQHMTQSVGSMQLSPTAAGATGMTGFSACNSPSHACHTMQISNALSSPTGNGLSGSLSRLDDDSFQRSIGARQSPFCFDSTSLAAASRVKADLDSPSRLAHGTDASSGSAAAAGMRGPFSPVPGDSATLMQQSSMFD